MHNSLIGLKIEPPEPAIPQRQIGISGADIYLPGNASVEVLESASQFFVFGQVESQELVTEAGDGKDGTMNCGTIYLT